MVQMTIYMEKSSMNIAIARPCQKKSCDGLYQGIWEAFCCSSSWWMPGLMFAKLCTVPGDDTCNSGRCPLTDLSRGS